MIKLKPWPRYFSSLEEVRRVYVNRSGGFGRCQSVYYWIEPAQPDENGRDWRFTWELRDAVSAAHASDIAREAWHFQDTELPAFVAQANKFLAFSMISWADWCRLADLEVYQQSEVVFRCQQKGQSSPPQRRQRRHCPS